jgi:hypothetical protein
MHTEQGSRRTGHVQTQAEKDTKACKTDFNSYVRDMVNNNTGNKKNILLYKKQTEKTMAYLP